MELNINNFFWSKQADRAFTTIFGFKRLCYIQCDVSDLDLGTFFYPKVKKMLGNGWEIFKKCLIVMTFRLKNVNLMC